MPVRTLAPRWARALTEIFQPPVVLAALMVGWTAFVLLRRPAQRGAVPAAPPA